MSNLNDFIIEDETLKEYKGTEKTVIIPDGIKKITGFRTWPINEDETTEEIVFPNTLEIIGGGAFSNCNSLRRIVIPDSVTDIGQSAFSWCRNLQEVKLPQNIKVIPQYAFMYCNALSEILIPASVEEIGKSAFTGSGLKEFTLEGNAILIQNEAFEFCRQLEKVTLCDSVNYIGKEAFKGCSKLKSIDLPQNLRYIGARAFEGCQVLENVVFPSALKEIEENAFNGCISLDYSELPVSIEKIASNAFIGCSKFCNSDGNTIWGKTLLKAECEGEVLTIPEGIEVVEEFAIAFTYKKAIKEIVFPKSIKEIREMLPTGIGVLGTGEPIKITLRDDYFRQSNKLPSKATDRLLYVCYQNKMDLPLEEYAGLYLFQTAKALIQWSHPQLLIDKNKGGMALINVLKGSKKTATFTKAAEFFYENKTEISADVMNDFYELSKAVKAKKAVELIEPCLADLSDTTESNGSLREIEKFCREKFAEHYLDKALSTVGVRAESLDGVLYADTKESVPLFVIKCAVCPYFSHSKNPLWNGWELNSDADKIATEFDKDTFLSMLEKVADIDAFDFKHEVITPYVRYAGGDCVKRMSAKARELHDWWRYGQRGRNCEDAIKRALLLNDSKEAMIYAEKHRRLNWYAQIRGTDENTLRDTKLADFGFDDERKIVYDLGGNSLTATLGSDLTVKLFDNNAEKFVKSVPKKNADASKVEQASNAIKGLKKNIKDTVNTRNKLLFEAFLTGKEKPGEAWKAAYTGNPVLHKVAELIIWSQNNSTFILTENDFVNCNGEKYTYDETYPVKVAHPREMTKEEVDSWKEYVRNNSIRQPFLQIWEPVVNLDAVNEERYLGIMIPYGMLFKRDKHGIYSYDSNFHNDISFSFDDCEAKVERRDWSRHEIGMDDKFEITSFRIKNATRKSNHVVTYLDKVASIDKILQDDIETVAPMLESFTVAQITEFIQLASENNCIKVLAKLMDYKNKTYPNYANFENFTLE